MNRIFTKWCAAVGLAFTLGQPAVAGPAFDQIHALVTQSFRAQAEAGEALNRSALLVAEVLAWEGASDAGAISAQDQVRIKYLLSDWRHRTRDFLARQASHSPAVFATAVESLIELGALIDAPTVRTLTHHAEQFGQAQSERMPRLLTLFATHADATAVAHHLRHDPQLVTLAALDALTSHSPLRPSFWHGADNWIHNRRYSNYQTQGTATIYRGMRFEAGDIILADPNTDARGLEVSFTASRTGLSHCGLLFYLDESAHRIPAVLEVHTGGLRVVPLVTFLSPGFVSYAEVYRLRSYGDRSPADWDSRLTGIARRLLREQLGIDFNARPIPERGYAGMRQRFQKGVFSASLIDAVLKSMGVDLQLKETPLELGARLNLAQLGLDRLAERGQLITPTSLKINPGLKRVGTIDNDFISNVQRELLVGSSESDYSAGDYLAHRELAPAQMSLLRGGALYRLVRFYADQVERETFVGRGILKVAQSLYGISPQMLPQATATSLGAMAALNGRLVRAQRMMNCPSLVAAVDAPFPFDLQQLESDPASRDRVRQAMERSGFNRAFRE